MFSDNAKLILCKRYLVKGADYSECERCGVKHESIENMLVRVSGGNKEFYDLMANLEFLPSSPTLFNMGTGKGTNSACFALSVKDSMEDIMSCATKAALIQKWGGGVGFNLSNIRAKNSIIATTHGRSCGPLSIMEVLQSIALMITQGGKRQGAQLAFLDVYHKDIKEFIHCKDSGNNLSTFNLSVALSDLFMDKAVNDNNSQEHLLLKEIAESTWKTGDPGVIFSDTVEKGNTTPYLGKIDSVNPCLLGNTRILTQEGLKKISSFSTATIFTPNGWSTGKAWYTGNKTVCKIILSNGQSIITTPNHKFKIGDSKLEAITLKDVPIEPFVGNGWPSGKTDFDEKSLLQMGFFQGDGGLHEGGGAYVYIGNKDADVRNIFSEFTKTHKSRKYAYYIPCGSTILHNLNIIGFDSKILPERVLPVELWEQSCQSVKTFLKGLFSANGSVLKTAERITLKTTNLTLAREVQLLLLAIGFRPYITTSKAKNIKWNNGTYTSRESYDLNISASEVCKFAAEIGFIQKYKMDIAQSIKYQYKGRRRKPSVVAIENLSEAAVFDFNVEDVSHMGWANGFTVSNCGEVPMMSEESCNIGSINLTSVLDNECLDFNKLERITRQAVCFLDYILDNNLFPIKSIEEKTLKTRKLGLGIMGWADLLGVLNIKYDSNDAIELAEKIMSFIKAVAVNTSQNLAASKGCFPAYEGLKEIAPRNATLTCIAPTGSLSILADISSGIEPHYALENKRTLGDGSVLIEKAKCLEINPTFIPKTAGEISYEWHIKHQAAFQKYTDLAISKTVGLPNNATVDDVYNAYVMMWQSGCKGGTIYRDGSRKEQVLNKIEITKESSPNGATQLFLTIPKDVTTENHLQKDNTIITTIKNNNEMIRPEVTEGKTYRVATGCGNIYVTINSNDNKVCELFATLGKSGGCATAQMEAIGRLCSLAFRNNLPAEEIVEILRGIRCPSPTWHNGKPVLSCADAIGYALAKHIGTKIEFKDGKCPECGETMVNQEGCVKCLVCGYSRC